MSRPALGMRHTREGTSMPPGICGSGVRLRPRPRANVMGPSSEGHTSAREGLSGLNCARWSGASKVWRKTSSASATSQTVREPSAADDMSLRPSRDHATLRIAADSSALSDTSSRATERVWKSHTCTEPAAVPAARRVPRRLNATHVALPC